MDKFGKTFGFSFWPGEKIEQFLHVVVHHSWLFSEAKKHTVNANTQKNFADMAGETSVQSWYSGEEESESGQCRLLEFFCCRNPWDYVSPWALVLYSEGIRFVKLFRRLERKTTLWPKEMLSAITDSNEPAPWDDSNMKVFFTNNT